MVNLHNVSELPGNMRKEMEDTFGMVPSFMRTLPPTAARLFWESLRDFDLSDETALDGKTKQLIGVGVAASIPCHYCVLFHTEAARLNGATDQEIEEAVFMASTTRQGSTILNGVQMDQETFRSELDEMVTYIQSQGQEAAAPPA